MYGVFGEGPDDTIMLAAGCMRGPGLDSCEAELLALEFQWPLFHFLLDGRNVGVPILFMLFFVI